MVVGLTVAAVVVLAGLSWLMYFLVSSARKLGSGANELAGRFASLDEELRSIPKLIEGLTRVCQSQIDQLVQVQEVVATLQKTLFSGGGGGFTAYDERDASTEYEVKEAMAQGGISREDATARVKEKTLFEDLAKNPIGGIG